MDASVEAHMNDALERVREQIATLERRVEAQDSAGADVAHRQVAWAHEQLAVDDRHADMFVRAQDALQEDVARHELAAGRLRLQNAADAETTEHDDAELGEIRDSIAEMRRELAAVPAQRVAGQKALKDARQALSHRLDSAFFVTSMLPRMHLYHRKG
jgi:hypothetical protein